MLIVTALVVITAIWGVISEEIDWPEAAIYCVIVAVVWAATFFLRGVPGTMYGGVAVLAVTGIVVLFRVGLHNASAR